ncbi:hypothetical protein EDE05_108217 [Neorhizobium sp. R1-B]|uniref:hypothetical protein n=1 Tax=Neorhizobium TaxID=1525371 RepID=UPI000CFA5739|nr:MULTISPECIES: hypothetical protein [Neorhizobium]TCV71303.1 hypothetical protein EDE09_1066 [Neorhizobium sp. S3-V5DH]TDX82540.1 hypothetical protein EDE05_108217 [Neorhizobium sp. R1-B]
MKQTAKPASKVVDGDGTILEEDRQLTQLLLRNAVQLPQNTGATDARRRVTVKELLLLICGLPILWLQAIALGRVGREYDEL